MVPFLTLRPCMWNFVPNMYAILLPARTMEDSGIQSLFTKGFLLAACLLCFCLPSLHATERVSVVSIPATPSEGQNVTFSVENVTGTIRQVDWFRGLVTDGGARIFSYFPGNVGRPQRNGVQFTQREYGFPNGSLLIAGVRPSDIKPYTVLILLRPKGTLKGMIELHLASSTTQSPSVTSTPQTPSVQEPPKIPLMLGWIVAGVVVGILLAGALGAIMVYRFVLKKAEPGTRVAAKLDPKGKRLASSRYSDKEPIYEMMDSPLESPNMAGKELPPIPPLPSTCPKLDSNYMDLLRRAESIYSEIKR